MDERVGAEPGREGDQPGASWEALYRETSERVFRLALRMTGDPDVAADVTHDTFVRIHERRAQFEGRGSLGGWVYRIASNIARDRLRRSRFTASFHGNGAGGERGGERPRGEVRALLREALERLPEDQRTVLLLHEVDGYTHPEISDMLDIAVGTSRARLSRAKAAMRELLDHTLE